MTKAAIFGAAGTIGRFVAEELERRDVPYRVVGKTRRKLQDTYGEMPHAEIVEADLCDLHSAKTAAQGVDTIIYTVGVPYTAFQLHPKLMQTTVDAAASVNVERLVVVSNVYSYGVPQTRTVAETHPRLPLTHKGRMRKEQEDIALEAHKRGRLSSLIVRLPDFYGPHADNSLANPIVRAALTGKTANWLGPIQTPHEFVFVPDTGPVIIELASRNQCYGEAWNYGGPGEITGGEFIQKIFRAVGREPKFRSAGRTILNILGWFNPLMKELVEMAYLQETPVLLDDSRLRQTLVQVHKTTYDEGIRRTLEWMRGAT